MEVFYEKDKYYPIGGACFVRGMHKAAESEENRRV
jgi:hypothetical protein